MSEVAPLMQEGFKAVSGQDLNDEAARMLAATHPDFLDNALATGEKRYGDLDNYLVKATGLASEGSAQLIKLLVEI